VRVVQPSISAISSQQSNSFGAGCAALRTGVVFMEAPKNDDERQTALTFKRRDRINGHERESNGQGQAAKPGPAMVARPAVLLPDGLASCPSNMKTANVTRLSETGEKKRRKVLALTETEKAGCNEPEKSAFCHDFPK
jgi:hypothetical protein